METGSGSGLRRVKRSKLKARTRKTATKAVTRDSTPLPVDVAPDEEPEYSDEQFYADLRKASKQLDLMERKALEEHARGKTRKFPV